MYFLTWSLDLTEKYRFSLSECIEMMMLFGGMVIQSFGGRVR